MSISTTQRSLAHSPAQALSPQHQQQQETQQQPPVHSPSFSGLLLPTGFPASAAATYTLSTAGNSNNSNSTSINVQPNGGADNNSGGNCEDTLPPPRIPDNVNNVEDEYDDDDSLPWPDHYPEPYPEKNPCFAKRTSATLETGGTLVYSRPEPVVVKNNLDSSSSSKSGGVNGVANDGVGGGDKGGVNEAKEGVRRITDKYAAPALLIRNGSVSSPPAASSSATATAATTTQPGPSSASSTTTTPTPVSSSSATAGGVTHKETLPSSPTPSITITASPPPPPAPCFVYNPFPPFNAGVPLSPTSLVGPASDSGFARSPLSGGGVIGTGVNSPTTTTTTASHTGSPTAISVVSQRSSFINASNPVNNQNSSSTFSRLSTSSSFGGGGSVVVVNNNYNNNFINNYNNNNSFLAGTGGLRLSSSSGGIIIGDAAAVPSNRNSVSSRLSSTGSIGGGVPVPGGTLNQNVTMRNGNARPLVLPPLQAPACNSSSADANDVSPRSPGVTIASLGGGVGGLAGMGGIGGGGTLGRGFQSVSGITLGNLGDGVTDQDVQQVEMFYRSHKTEVIVCPCLANFYIGAAASAPSTIELDVASSTSTSSSASTPKTTTKNPKDKKGKSPGKDNAKQPEKDQQINKTAGGGGGGGEDGGDQQSSSASAPVSGSDTWEFVTTGIPLVVLDSGDHHRARQLSIVVAEKGTGFMLWKDVVSRLTKYSCPHSNFHTLRISTDSNKLGGLSFDDNKAAAEFAAAIIKLTENPEDDLFLLSKKGKKNRKKQESMRKKQNKYKPPKKQDISQPCCFQHVTKLERPQLTPGVGMLLPPNSFPPAPSGSVSSLCDVMQDQLPLPLSRARSASSELSDGSTAASSDR